MFVYSSKPNKLGDLEWPITTIKNYIVQSLGADLVALARVSLYNRLKAAQMRSKLIMTVHDSIVLDCPEEEWEQAAKMAISCVKDVPKNFERLFKIPFNLSLSGKIMYGNTLGTMEEYV